MERTIPYDGSGPYIHISFSPEDEAAAIPIIARMQKDGLPLWFRDEDQEAAPGDDQIADRVAACGCFVALLSEQYLASENCKDELSYARDREKQQLLIYLEDVQLPRGMAMRMGRNQAVFYNRYANKEEFFEKLYEAQDLQPFFQGRALPKTQTPESRRRSRSRRNLIGGIAAVVLIAGAAGVGAYLGQRQQTQPEEVPQSTDSPTAIATEAPQEVLVDTSQLEAKSLGTQVQGDFFTLALSVRNKTGAALALNIKNCYINGAYCELSWSGLLSGEQPGEILLQWERSQLEFYGLDPANVTSITGELDGQYQDGSGFLEKVTFSAFPQGGDGGEPISYTPAQTDVLLMNTQDYGVYAGESSYDPDSNAWVQTLVLINRSDRSAVFSLVDAQINGYSAPVNGKLEVRAGCIARAEFYVTEEYWRATGDEKVLACQGQVQVADADAYCCVPVTISPEGAGAFFGTEAVELTQEQLLLENQWVRLGQLETNWSAPETMQQFYGENLTEEPCVLSAVLGADSQLDEALSGTLPPIRVLLQPGAHSFLQLLDREISGNLETRDADLYLLVSASTLDGEELFSEKVTWERDP